MAKKVKIVFPESAKRWAHFQGGGKDRFETAPDAQGLVRLLKGKRKPKVAMEIGSGVGRISVYLANVLGWKGTSIVLVDGDGGSKKTLGAGIYPDLNDRFCNSLDATVEFCGTNWPDFDDIETLNAKDYGPGKIPAPRRFKNKVNLAYSFKSIGFHWPVAGYLDWLHPCMAKGGMVVFEVRSYNSKFWGFTEDQIASVSLNKWEMVTKPSKRAKFSLLVLRKK